jgi:phenylacetate-coenzyme A ligase PaaK-like adenylate-forming protein
LETSTQFKQNLHKVNANDFNSIALTLFKIQYRENEVYKNYIEQLGINPFLITQIEEIPFLPISFFKTHTVRTGIWQPETIFTSSGTTGITTSRHFVKDITFYLNHAEQLFNSLFGSLTDYHFLALLPSYLEREGSSLVAMADYFIKRSSSVHSGFYLNNLNELVQKIKLLKNGNRKIILLGVSFALLDLAENYSLDLSHCTIMETGGMKGRRKEIIREELHQTMRDRFNIAQITSEYGMTELLSQAYSLQNGYYQCPWSMKILIRDVYDPLQLESVGRVGIIKVIDLANVDSCSFIETQDLGRLNSEGNFEVLGRVDNSDSRGCNLLV